MALALIHHFFKVLLILIEATINRCLDSIVRHLGNLWHSA